MASGLLPTRLGAVCSQVLQPSLFGADAGRRRLLPAGSAHA